MLEWTRRLNTCYHTPLPKHTPQEGPEETPFAVCMYCGMCQMLFHMHSYVHYVCEYGRNTWHLGQGKQLFFIDTCRSTARVTLQH